MIVALIQLKSIDIVGKHLYKHNSCFERAKIYKNRTS